MNDLDPKTPNWFLRWYSNHFVHLELKVNILLWGVGIICAALIAEVVRRFLQ